MSSTHDAPGLPVLPFVTGISSASTGLHLIDRETAEQALTADTAGPGLRATAACGMLATLPQTRLEPSAWPGSDWCPTCRWTAAITTNQISDLLDAITPAGNERHVLIRLGVDPDLVRRTCEAILGSVRARGHELEDLEVGGIVQLLAEATLHAPVLAVPEDCADGTCDHQPELPPGDPSRGIPTEDGDCPLPEAAAVCGACTMRAGTWAGEWAGQYMSECYIHAPCQILTAIASSFNVPSAAHDTNARP